MELHTKVFIEKAGLNGEAEKVEELRHAETLLFAEDELIDYLGDNLSDVIANHTEADDNWYDNDIQFSLAFENYEITGCASYGCNSLNIDLDFLHNKKSKFTSSFPDEVSDFHGLSSAFVDSISSYFEDLKNDVILKEKNDYSNKLMSTGIAAMFASPRAHQ